MSNQELVEWTKVTLHLESGQTVEPFYIEDDGLKAFNEAVSNLQPVVLYGLRARPLIVKVGITVNPLQVTCFDIERCPHLKYHPTEPQL